MAGADQTPGRNQTGPKPVAVFDGKTFAAWEGDLTFFRMEDGAIVGGTLEG
jgi:hypothetical protein